MHVHQLELCTISILSDITLKYTLDPFIHQVFLFFRDGMEHKRRVSVETARIFFSSLGCLMLGTLVYTVLTDGSPFRRELLTP